MGKRQGRGRRNMAANQAVKIRVHSGDSFMFDDKRDLQFLTLLSDEIQDDQFNVITEGLQLQKALASSLMVFDSDEEGGEEDEEDNSDGKLSPGSAAAREEISSFLEKTVPLVVTYSDETDEDEDFAGKSAVETGILSDDYAVEEENRSYLEKAIRSSSLKNTDSGDTDDEEKIAAAAKSSSDTALLFDDSAVEEGKSFTSLKIADSDHTGEGKNSAAKSSPLIPDHSAASEDEDWSFIENSQLTSLKITDSADTGTGKVKNAAATKSWPKTIPDDFAPNDENWAFLNEFCNLCATEDKMRRLIRVSGCGHYFCNYCFEWYTSTELGSEKCSVKCPAETCFNQIDSDHCVALMLQHSLDSRCESMSDWEFLDSQNLP